MYVLLSLAPDDLVPSIHCLMTLDAGVVRQEKPPEGLNGNALLGTALGDHVQCLLQRRLVTL